MTPSTVRSNANRASLRREQTPPEVSNITEERVNTIMDVQITSPVSPHQALPRHLVGDLGAVRRRSKRRTSPAGLEDRPVRRSRPEVDRIAPFSPFTQYLRPEFSQRQRSEFEHVTAAPRISEISSSTRSPATLTAGPIDGSSASQLDSLPTLHELRVNCHTDHRNHHHSYDYTHLPAPPPAHPGDHAEQHEYSPLPCQQQIQWYGVTAAQQQLSLTSLPYSSTAVYPTRHSPASPKRPGQQFSPPPFPAPLLQAEVAHLAAAPGAAQNFNPPASRDLTHLLHHHNQQHHSPNHPVGETKSPKHDSGPFSTLHRDPYTPNQSSTSFSSPVALEEPRQSRDHSSLALPASGADLGAALIGLETTTVNTSMATAPSTISSAAGSLYYSPYPYASAGATGSPSSALSSSTPRTYHQTRHLSSNVTTQYHLDLKRIDPTVSAVAYPSQYDQSFVQHHKQHPTSPATSLPTGVPQGHVAYTDSAYQDNYAQNQTRPSHDRHQHLGYSGQAKMEGDSDQWLMLPAGPQPTEDEPPLEQLRGQQHYRHHHMSDLQVIPVLASNGIGQPWEDASVHVTTQEMEQAAQPPRGNKKPSTEGKKSNTRGKFNEEARKITAMTRKSGACIRCKCQRVRCIPSQSNDPFAPCETCLKVNKASKKSIHPDICRRYRLQAIVLSRQGGLNFTTRWQGTQMKDVGDRVDDIVRFVELKIFYHHDSQRQDLFPKPIRLEVHKFRPRPGDVLHRKWITKDNSAMTTELTPFALNSINDAAVAIKEFIRVHAFSAMTVAVSDSDVIVKDTYRMAMDYYNTVKGLEEGQSAERIFLESLFTLWFAIRLATGSAYISGTDKLDMLPETRPGYPLGNRISLPRMITAQVDSILATKFLKSGTTNVSKLLENHLRSNNPRYWFMLYLANFILLHEISVATRDRGRYARDNQLPTRFSLPSVVRDQHFSANNLLAHWHYFKTENDPSKMEMTDHQKIQKTPMASLNEEQRAFVWKWWDYMKQPAVLEYLCPSDQREQDTRLEHPLYFVAQMFMPQWSEKTTFQG